MTVGGNIKRIRKERGLTQKQLAELCGINEVNIHKYEAEKQNPKIETIERIAAALNVNVWDIKSINESQLAESVRRFEAIDTYLKRMGFKVKLSQTGTDEYEVILSKDNDTATFTGKEFDDLILGAKEVIEGAFYKKVVERGKKK